MASIINRIDRVLKTKEDLQSFVVVAFILFILFVKVYMMSVNTKVGNAVNTQTNADVVKTQATSNS